MSLIPGGDPRYDVGRTGLPSWAKRDTGPLNTYVPGPMSSEPLNNAHHADVRMWVSGLIFAAVIVFVVVNAQTEVVGSVLGLILLWALYGVPTWLRGRVGLRVDGDRAEVHGWFRTVEFKGEDVAKVQYVFAGRSPDHRLLLRDGRRIVVVASRLEKGHSTLFEWLRRYAPTAEYDQKSLDVRDMLVTRGLMGAPGDAWDKYGPTRAANGQPSDIDPTRIPEEPVAASTPLPEEQPGEAPLRLEGSPTAPGEAAASTPLPEEPVGEADRRLEGSRADKQPEDTIRIPEEELREARQRLARRIPDDPSLHRIPEGTLAGTSPAVVPSDVEPPAPQQERPESEDS